MRTGEANKMATHGTVKAERSQVGYRLKGQTHLTLVAKTHLCPLRYSGLLLLIGCLPARAMSVVLYSAVAGHGL